MVINASGNEGMEGMMYSVGAGINIRSREVYML